MNWKGSVKTLRTIVLTAGIIVAAEATIFGSINMYLHHDIDYEVDGERIMQKVDGIVSYTKVEIEDDYVKMSREKWFDTKKYEGAVDGVVEELYISGNMFARDEKRKSKFLYRDINFEGNEDLFLAADTVFQEQLKRFSL